MRLISHSFASSVRIVFLLTGKVPVDFVDNLTDEFTDDIHLTNIKPAIVNSSSKKR